MKRMKIGVFDSVGLQDGWAHPSADGLRYLDPEYWEEKARLAEESGMDFYFFADNFGYPTGGDGLLTAAAVQAGNAFPRLDPFAILPIAMRATSRLGFVVTATTGIDHPIQLARLLSSLDHFSRGRIGWNIVTGAGADVLSGLLGQSSVTPHDLRYEIADEYLEVAVRFWEDCWRDDAVVGDQGSRTYADAGRIQRVEYAGDHYRTLGYLPVPPSPQRTPLLFQAGTSDAGREYAGRHAEGVFVQGHLAESAADIRARAMAAGRNPEAISILTSVRIFAAATDAEAQALKREYDMLQSDENTAARFRARTGVDLLSLDPGMPLTQLPASELAVELGRTYIERFTTGAAPLPTVRQILDQLKGVSDPLTVLVGDGATVANGLERLVDEFGLDGMMLQPTMGTTTLRAFRDHVAPELRRRGRVGDTVGDTFRERMSGRTEYDGVHAESVRAGAVV